MEDYEISVQELSKRDANSYIPRSISGMTAPIPMEIYRESLHVPKDILEADYEKYEDKPLIFIL